MLASFNTFYPYNFSVVRTTMDYNGVNTTVSGLPAYSYTWTVTVNSYRTAAVTAQNTVFNFLLSNLSNTVNTSTVISPSYNSIQAHSPPVQGTFGLTINNTAITYWNSTLNAYSADLPYNTASWNLQYYIQQSLGYNYI
jgi:hypothetical protein